MPKQKVNQEESQPSKTAEDKSKGSFKEKRALCIASLDTNVEKLDFKGKSYLTVAKRHNHLLKFFPESKIDEQIIYQDDKKVIAKTTLYIGDTPYSVGHAEEIRDANFINKTSALENAATSALGRCLATFGLHGTEFASADELVNAVINQGASTKNSIKDSIKKQTTETKLTALYSDWKKENDLIEKSFESQQQTIKTNGGQNNVNKQQQQW
jgi:hypothetical protein|tara:strand:+ start:249 stop:884 length:636 start_codon:yes stop_codon:yes gene_type:complete